MLDAMELIEGDRHAGPISGLVIEHVETDRKRYLDLLLLADEQEDMVDRYLDSGDMYVVLVDGSAVGECGRRQGDGRGEPGDALRLVYLCAGIRTERHEEQAVKITVVAVGKLKERFWADACAEYAKRLQAFATVKMVEVPDRDPAKFGGEDAGRALEGKGILAAIPERAHVILLDIGGTERSSEEIAARLDGLMTRGSSNIAFVIGGSCGVSREVRERADERLSFGRITLPHNLARVVLLEQVYRAFKIMRGEPYHK